jgi:hypothetical protein
MGQHFFLLPRPEGLGNRIFRARQWNLPRPEGRGNGTCNGRYLSRHLVFDQQRINTENG